MSHRYAGQWIAGAHLHGNAGLGVLGSQVPSGGEHGAPPMYAQLLASDMTKEVRWLITTPPTGLTSFFTYENGAYTAAGPDGTYSFNWDFYVDGVLRSSHTASFTIGNLLSGSGDSQSGGSGGITVSTTLSGEGGSASNGVGALLGDVTLFGEGSGKSEGSGGVSVPEFLSGDGASGASASGNVVSDGPVTLTPQDIAAVAAAVWAAPDAVAAHSKLDAILAKLTC